MVPRMNLCMPLVSTLVLCILCFPPSSNAQPMVLTPTPAPAPAPEFINLTDLLSVAGPFHTFLNYLQTTKVIQTLQNQANNTEEGLTLFVPEDKAFSSLKNPSLSNLTQDQIKNLCLFHAMPHYYTLSDFNKLSDQNPLQTLAGGGGGFGLNFTDNSGTVHIDSGWTKTKIISAVHAADPVAIYETDRVLLPEAIFGTDIPPASAPAPAPEAHHGNAPTADSTPSDTGSPSSSPPGSSADRVMGSSGKGFVVLAFVGGIMMMMFW